MNQSARLTNNYKKQYIGLILVCLGMLFVGAIIDSKILFVAFIGVIGFIYFISRKIEDVFFMCIAILPNSELLKGSLFILSIQKIMFVIALLGFMYYVKHIKSMRIPFKYYAIWYMYIVFNGICIGNTTVSGLIAILFLFIISMVADLVIDQNPKRAEKFVIAVVAGFSFITMIAVIEMLIEKTFFYSRWVGNERYRYGIIRPGSTVADPNNICYMLVPFLFWLEMNAVKKVIPKIYRLFIKWLSIIIIIGTSSRTGIIALAMGVLAFFIAKRKSSFVISIPILGAFAVPVMNLAEKISLMFEESTNFRNHIIEQAFKVWQENKMFGVGASNMLISLNSTNTALNTMNTYIYFLLCYGLIGIVLYIIFWVLLLKKDVINWFVKKTISKDVVLRICSIMTALVLAYTLDTFYLAFMWLCPSVFKAMDVLESNEEGKIKG